MSRRPLIAGNWKLHNTVAQSLDLARQIEQGLDHATACEVVIAPVFTALHAVGGLLSAGSKLQLAGQDVYWQERGAFTGEVSAVLLRDVGCTHVIVGHSERRQFFAESDATVLQKTRAALAQPLTPIVCVGETLEQRRAGKTLDVVLGQARAVWRQVETAALPKLLFAYEPVWAIGTGLAATPADAEEVHAALRSALAADHGHTVASQVRLLYGGSVKPDNAASLLAQTNIDGALVGGASLVAADFLAIVRAAAPT